MSKLFRDYCMLFYLNQYRIIRLLIASLPTGRLVANCSFWLPAHSFTCNASRKPLPSILNASTSNIMAKPGASASIGLLVIIKL